MFQKLQQPVMIDVVKETSDVRIHYPVHFLPRDSHVQGIQGAVTVSSRTKTVTQPKKVLFIDTFENHPHSLLDNLVLQCRDPEGPQLAIELGNPSSFGWFCPVRAPMYSTMQINDPRFEVFGVRGPCLAINAWGGVLLEVEETCLQQVRRDMVQQIVEPCLLIFPCRFSYAQQPTRFDNPALCPDQ